LERHYGGKDREVIWPDGHVELLFHFGAAYHWQNRKLPCSFVIGPLSRYLTLDAAGPLRLWGARFYPWGFFPLLRIPMVELRDRIIPFADLWGTATREDSPIHSLHHPNQPDILLIRRKIVFISDSIH
jgi:hypothetical protein